MILRRACYISIIITVQLLCNLNASASNLYVVYDDESILFTKIAKSISEDFNFGEPLKIGEHIPIKSSKDIVISIGGKASEYAILEFKEAKLITSFISSLNYYRMLKKHQFLDNKNISAVFIDPSFKSQFALIKQVFPHNPSAIIFLSKKSSFVKKELISAAHEIGVVLKIYDYENDNQMLRMLAQQKNISALLTIPDEDAIRLDNFRSVLEVAYVSGIGVIGYSEAMVTAGAVASSFVRLNDMTSEIKDKINFYIKENGFSRSTYFSHLDIKVNYNVLDSMNIVTKNISTIQEEVAKNMGSREWIVYSETKK